MSLITTTIGDTIIESNQSSVKIISQEQTSSTLGTTSRMEMYDQHQGVSLKTKRRQSDRGYQGSSSYQESSNYQRSSNYGNQGNQN